MGVWILNWQNIPVVFYSLIPSVLYRLPSKGNAEDAGEEEKFSSEILTVPLGLCRSRRGNMNLNLELHFKPSCSLLKYQKE